MREALSSLTTRGRVLLAGGATAAACALVLGLPSLLRIGAFCVLLPLLTLLVTGRARYRISLDRVVEPVRAACGQSVTVTLTVRNEGFSPPGTVVLEDAVGYALGSRPRVRLERLPRGEEVRHDYRVSSDVRGRHEIGPALLRVSDPFGLVEVRREFRTRTPLTVLPPVVPLHDPARRDEAATGTGGRDPRLRHTGGETTVRAYRRGDDVRRVHWRSSARLGELMVRQEDHPRRPSSVLLLDVRTQSHRGHGAASSFETAVQATASALVHLNGLGHDVVLVAGPNVHRVDHDDPGALGRALDELAEVQTVPSTELPPVPSQHLPGRPHLVAVLGALAPGDDAALRPWRTQSGRAHALVLDVMSWGRGSGRGSRRADAPASHTDGQATAAGPEGWRCAVVGPRTAIAHAWQELA